MFHNDHRPPHFHAEHGDDQMVVAIETLAVIGGKLRPRAAGMVMEWAMQYQDELRHDWQQARSLEPLDRSASVTPLSCNGFWRTVTERHSRKFRSSLLASAKNGG